MFDISRSEITDGSLPKALVVLAAPLLVQNLVQVLQQVVDVFWLGRLGGDAVAAVGLNFPILGLLATVAIGASVGTQVVVSQRAGAEDLEGSRRAAVNGLAVGFVVGLAVGLLAFWFARDIVGLFGTDEPVARMAVNYLAVYALVMPIITASDVLESGFVGWGDARAALYINVFAVGINIVLDPFLIFGWGPFPELDVAGAALATGIGYTGGLLLAIGMAVRGRDDFVIDRTVLEIRREDVAEIVDVGWPTAGQFLAGQSVRVVMVAIVVAVGGSAGLAAYTIGARVASVAFIPAMGLQQAAQSVVGQNLGAEKPARARQATWTGVAIAGGALTVVGAVQLLVPETLTALFVPDVTAAELELTVEYLRILAYGYWAIGATYLLQAGFNGASRTRTSFVATLLQYWVVRLPVAALLAYPLELGVVGVFWAVTLSNVAAAIGLGLYYWRETANGMNARAASEAAASAAGD
ncbi:MATE family efflux transporter [Natronobeatus ordinarius]|uniref:MATE family efflux transporter n=1 Tax=Natronobeatus ordinarius TaxID=2963433 RepID=UPI0020CF5175|nr:MATE family efflux transporter [Natronobeatus ordinarius]